MLSPLYGQLSPLRIPTLSLELPKTIAGLQLWLDATTGLYDATSGGSLVTTDSTAVARWEDQSGNARHFVQATANNRPVLKTSQLNGKNVVSFDGTNDAIQNASSTLFRNVSGYTVFIVRKQRSTISGTKVVCSNGATIRFELICGAINRIQPRARRFSTDGLVSLAVPQNNTTPGNFEMFCALVDHSITTCKFYKKGTLNASNANFLTTGNTNDASASTVLGAQGGGGTVPADIDVSEFLIYHEALSDTDRGKIESYLTTKWGL